MLRHEHAVSSSLPVYIIWKANGIDSWLNADHKITYHSSHIIIGSGLDDDEAALDQDNWTIDADLAGVSNLALANMAYGADIKYVDGNWGEDGTGEIKR
ncbi:hypothetical protein ACO22_05470 [Paracoccidioides brasiliensis]|uniref:Uncharacterized protein n=1 Tax=Paracoccidioides brasiliensis TaxID=121759 RepID=A0A1D2JA67_PARBR|nr:hypothetical protein ACO22_05470 [Paracoccidioides brasiliensis]